MTIAVNFFHLYNWKVDAWKKSGLQQDLNPWPPRYRCDALPTELWSHTLGASVNSPIEFMYPVRSELTWSIYEMNIGIGIAEVMGSNFFDALILFRLLLSGCSKAGKLTAMIHSSDLNLLSAVQICVVSYILSHQVNNEYHRNQPWSRC